jgi:hypothetical protein
VSKQKLNFKLKKEEVKAKSTEAIYVMSNKLKAALRRQEINFNEKQNSVAIELNNMK